MSEETNVFRKECRQLSDEEIARIDHLKDLAGELFNLMCPQNPNDTLLMTREMSFAKTKLEESVMWAVKALTA